MRVTAQSIQSFYDQRPQRQQLSENFSDFAAGTVGRYAAATSVSDAEFQSGVRMNTVSVHLTGNKHFNGWWDVVWKDTDFVIAKGSAYRGQSVKVGWTTIQDAAIVHASRAFGMDQRVSLNVKGKAGEKVEIFYVRGAEGTSFSQNGSMVSIGNLGQGAGISGDVSRRHVKLAIKDAPSKKSVSSNERFEVFHNDTYGYNRVGDRIGFLGGGAQKGDLDRAVKDLAAGKQPYVEPMYANR